MELVLVCGVLLVVSGLAWTAARLAADVCVVRIALRGVSPADRAMMAAATDAERAEIARALAGTRLVSWPARVWLRRRYQLG